MGMGYLLPRRRAEWGITRDDFQSVEQDVERESRG
jgi:hypothetical protein